MQSKLYALRKENGIDQTEMARKLGIARNTYMRKEKGQNEFTQDEMFKTASIFGKKIDDIFLPRKYQNGNK